MISWSVVEKFQFIQWVTWCFPNCYPANILHWVDTHGVSNSCSSFLALEPPWVSAEGLWAKTARTLVQAQVWNCSSPGSPAAGCALSYRENLPWQWLSSFSALFSFLSVCSVLFTLSTTRVLAEPWQDSSWQLEFGEVSCCEGLGALC